MKFLQQKVVLDDFCKRCSHALSTLSTSTNWFYKRKSKNCVLMTGAAKICKYNIFDVKICNRALDERFVGFLAVHKSLPISATLHETEIFWHKNLKHKFDWLVPSCSVVFFVCFFLPGYTVWGLRHLSRWTLIVQRLMTAFIRRWTQLFNV